MNHPLFSTPAKTQFLNLNDLRQSKPTQHIYDYNVPLKEGKGIIRFLKLDLGFRIVEIDAFFKTNIQLNLYQEENYLYFIYNTEGQVFHQFDKSKKIHHIEELKPTIVGSNSKEKGALLFKPNSSVRVSMICIDRSVIFKEYETEELNNRDEVKLSKTEGLLKALNKLKEKLYKCEINLPLAEQLRAIEPMEIPDEFIELLNVKSNYEKVLSIFLNEFYKEQYLEANQTNLSHLESQQIRKISEFVIDHIEIQHSIKSLCRECGLSPAKLQEGFKAMHGTTVSDFIRNKRLEKAERLFKTTDHNVSEVVYIVGITSRSYFCKIFKNKFGYSPSMFIKMHRSKNRHTQISV
ncbi:helix-turn-helix domain-containing protein [Winogradskyella ursingii]|uniref:helix-turn-helix domain-containing protein n=1 Tax=Winogradskyella ursingii TaxID=2686079 RepID=UPI0015CC2589|nr:AraC family transcriptional regulator [Winogradskyella ursingii]